MRVDVALRQRWLERTCGMCGIAGGCWTAAGSPLEPAVLFRMTEALAHRGPDGDGHVLLSAGDPLDPHVLERSDARLAGTARPGTAGAALGHRRLSIIDLSGGRQPLANEDGSIWVTFNGEIYDYREQRADLLRRGHVFRTESDTEVLVHLYEEYGPDFVQRLRGMFALAVWDAPRGRLLLARDRLGKKPLIYREEPGRLLFGSELKALLAVPGTPRVLDPAALDDFLVYQYVPHPQCILQGFAKLPPGCRALYETGSGRLTVERYWHAPYETEAADPQSALDGTNGRAPTSSVPVSEEAWRRVLRETLTEAVRLRLRSDVPLGAFLSGGIDSTIIAGLMKECSAGDVHTFSIGFPVAEYDEREFARAAAAHLGTVHHEEVVDPQAVEVLPLLAKQYDEPFADSSAIPTLHLSRITRKSVTVALTGDGGDELFAGYERYRAVLWGAAVDRLPGPLRRFVTDGPWQRLPGGGGQRSVLRRAKRWLAALGEPPERRYLTWITTFDAERRGRLYSGGLKARLGEHDPASFVLEAYGACRNRDLLTRTTCVDVATYLPCDILTKVDIASMTYALECRCPFLDGKVMDLAARMPAGLKWRDGRGKRILRETFADLLPPSIQRRGKMGFGVPLAHWFRDELRDLVRDVLGSQRCRERGLFEPAEVSRLIHEHQSEAWDHSARLWSLVVLELWQQTWVDGAGVSGSVSR